MEGTKHLTQETWNQEKQYRGKEDIVQCIIITGGC